MTGDLVVYGATGATGRRVVELAVEAGLKPVVAGRSAAGLEKLAGPLGLEVRTGGLTPGDLDRVCQDAAVVVSCVGPYTHHGRPVLEAALRHRAHYVDCSGEPRWVHSLLTEHNDNARSRGCTLVPGVGLGIATDVAARIAAAEVGDLARLAVAYRIIGMRPSTASMRSTVELLAAGAPVVDQGSVSWVPAGPCASG